MFHLKSNQCDVNLNDYEMPILVNQISKDFLTYAIQCLCGGNGTHTENGVNVISVLSRGQAGIIC